MALFLLGTLTNPWIWKILTTNIFIGILLLITTYSLYQRKKYFWLLLFFLLLAQLKITPRANLIYRDNDDQRIVQMRLRAYPYDLTRVGHIIEERNELISIFRIRENIFQNLDINHFFFAGFPRQTVGISEFEKFPFILLPFFVAGLVSLIKERKVDSLYLGSFFIPLAILGIIGNRSLMGPFSLFPFFVVSITAGFGFIKNLIYAKN